MTFSMRPARCDTSRRRWWHHYYYRGPQGQAVQILYSRTRSHSETIARHSISEPVLGFDMEWPWDADKRPRLQDKIALIQLASERKIALFHIALHEGETTDDLIAPTLREIIESPKIFKTGVAVLNADFKRLRTHFKLEPKGAFELSHLHNLVTYGARASEHVTTKIRSLSFQVEKHLGLPLWKGNVRTSDWSQPLNSDQITYAATDAYAGFMLFHCMNAKRLALEPVPPLPVLAETYPFTVSKSATIRLEVVTEEGKVQITTAADFYKIERESKHGNAEAEGTPVFEDTRKGEIRDSGEEETVVETVDTVTGPSQEATVETRLGHDKLQHSRKRQRIKDRKSRVDADNVENDTVRTSMDGSCWALYGRLASHRKQIAVAKDVPPFVIAHNTVLQTLSMYRPSNDRELLRMPGIGKRKPLEYGTPWLEIIAAFEAEQKKDGGHPRDQEAENQPESKTPEPKRRRIVRVGRSKEVLVSSDRPPAVLSTGISFQFSEASLADDPIITSRSEEDDDTEEEDDDINDNEDTAFGPPMQPPSPATLKRKRALAVQRDTETNKHQQSAQDARQTPVCITNSPPLDMVPITTPTLTSNDASNLRVIPAPASTIMPTASGVQVPEAPEPQLQTPLENMSRERMLLRKKLEAYVKSVIWAMHPKPSSPLVSGDTLQYLVTTMPQTIEEFRSVPGMQRLTKVCEVMKMDIWRTFEKWTRVPGLLATAGSSG